jgi:pimeloyl-ACP methyl ester carboxylesterase
MDTMLTVGNDRLWVDDSGGDGPAVLLVHPGIHDSSVWDPVLPLLEDHRLARYDARDFGRSSASSEEFLPLADLLAVLDHVGLERAHLVGNSMGGQNTLAAALEHPERVLSLTLLAPGIKGYDYPDDAPELEQEWEEVASSGDQAQMVELYGRVWCASGVDDAIRDQLVAMVAAEERHDTFEQDNPEQWSRAGDIAVPTAVVIGELDLPSMVTGSLDLAGRIPGAELVRLAGVDHLPSLREPQAVADVVRRTVARAG